MFVTEMQILVFDQASSVKMTGHSRGKVLSRMFMNLDSISVYKHENQDETNIQPSFISAGHSG